MRGGWALAVQRMAAARLVMAAAAGTVLLLTTVLAVVSLYAGSVTQAGVVAALRTADPVVSGLQVSLPIRGRSTGAVDAAVRARVEAAYTRVGHSTYASGLSQSQTLLGRSTRGVDELTYVGSTTTSPRMRGWSAGGGRPPV